MRKVALITDGWRRLFTYAWPAGILQRIRETGEDVNLYIFNSTGNWSRDAGYNRAEYNIYNLPELSDFDGIILELNNISSPAVLIHILLFSSSVIPNINSLEKPGLIGTSYNSSRLLSYTF